MVKQRTEMESYIGRLHGMAAMQSPIRMEEWLADGVVGWEDRRMMNGMN
jgi:hypothetical protein